MVPSLTAVDAAGEPLLPGLLYGDERGRAPTPRSGDATTGSPAETGELRNFARWMVAHAPDAAGLWPAQACQSRARGRGRARHVDRRDSAVVRLHRLGRDLVTEVGTASSSCGSSRRDGSGRVAFGDGTRTTARWRRDASMPSPRLVAGADHDGDVLVIFGTTLIIWAVTSSEAPVPGYWTIPHRPGKLLVGGPSNAGGCSATGRCVCSRRPTRAEPGASGVGAVPAGADSAQRPVPPRRARRPRPHTRRGRAPARRTRRQGSSGRDARRREHTGSSRAESSRRAAASSVDEWCRPCQRPLLRVDCVRVPEGRRSARVARSHRGRPRGADGHDRGPPVGGVGRGRSNPIRGSTRGRGATSGSSRCLITSSMGGSGRPRLPGAWASTSRSTARPAWARELHLLGPGVFDLDDDGVAIVVDPMAAGEDRIALPSTGARPRPSPSRTTRPEVSDRTGRVWCTAVGTAAVLTAVTVERLESDVLAVDLPPKLNQRRPDGVTAEREPTQSSQQDRTGQGDAGRPDRFAQQDDGRAHRQTVRTMPSGLTRTVWSGPPVTANANITAASASTAPRTCSSRLHTAGDAPRNRAATRGRNCRRRGSARCSATIWTRSRHASSSTTSGGAR